MSDVVGRGQVCKIPETGRLLPREVIITPRDPVCGMDVQEDEDRRLRSERQGQEFRFCSDQCKEEFDRNPDRYFNRFDNRNDNRRDNRQDQKQEAPFDNQSGNRSRNRKRDRRS